MDEDSSESIRFQAFSRIGDLAVYENVELPPLPSIFSPGA